MDDALFIQPIEENGTQTGWRLVVAIADPTAYIPENSAIEKRLANVVLPTTYLALTFQCYRVNYQMIFAHSCLMRNACISGLYRNRFSG